MERFRLPWACYAYTAYGYVANYLILPRTTERVHWDERGLVRGRVNGTTGVTEGGGGTRGCATAAAAAAAADTKDFSTSNRDSTRWQP